jgi:hypothetical protein
MNPFPKDWELIGLFECEPECLDADIPWCYNQLTFRTSRGDDQITCIISPGYEELQWEWRQNGLKITELNLHSVAGLDVMFENGKESLIAHFRDKFLIPLVLQLKPHINILWGTEEYLPGMSGPR